MTRLYLYIPFIICFLCSCKHSYHIDGAVATSFMNGNKLYLKTFKEKGWVIKDSADITHGKFQFSGIVDSTELVSLFIDNINIMPIVIEPGKVHVSLTESNIEASGTKCNDALYQFIKKRNHLEMKLDELDQKRISMIMNGANIREANEVFDLERNRLLEEMDSYTEQTIYKHMDNILGVTLFITVCELLPYPMLTPEVKRILSKAPRSFKNHQLVKEFLYLAGENQHFVDEFQQFNQQVLFPN